MSQSDTPLTNTVHDDLRQALSGVIRYLEIDEVVQRIDNDWAIHPEVAHMLAALTVARRCSRVLEFGAGVSSLVFAHALARLGGGSLTSVEQMPEWCRDNWRLVDKMPTVDAALIKASIRATFDRRGTYFRYDLSPQVLAERAPFDLVFIDAPQGGFGRDGTLHWCHPYLSDGALIVLDDAGRKRERRTIQRWLKIYTGLSLVFDDVTLGRGLTVLQFGGKTQRHLPAAEVLVSLYNYVRSAWERRSVRALERQALSRSKVQMG